MTEVTKPPGPHDRPARREPSRAPAKAAREIKRKSFGAPPPPDPPELEGLPLLDDELLEELELLELDEELELLDEEELELLLDELLEEDELDELLLELEEDELLLETALTCTTALALLTVATYVFTRLL